MPFLDWVNKNQAVQTSNDVPYHLLQHHKSYGDQDTAKDNLIIQGDNLQALKALLPFYTGKVKCIFIDPPYNTQSAFEHYDDKLEHSQWLSMMYPRLVLLRDLLAEDGSIWVTLDDREAHYFKVLMDEVFTRNSFVANVVWQKRTSPDARIHLGSAHDNVIVYSKSNTQVKFNKLSITLDQAKNYKNPDNDPRGAWASTDFTAQGWRPNQMYEIATPDGTRYSPPDGRCWANVESGFLKLQQDGRLWFGKDGNARPRVKNYLSEGDGVSSWTWWVNSEVGHNQEAKKENNTLFGADDAFDTPKPERLIKRVLEIATDTNDLILDSFLGSGTTAAVAHKMGRRYIGIEMGEHAVTHCIPRLEKVIDGEQGGISKTVEWQGGGGFSFYTLGAPVFDSDGHITADVRFKDLAAYIWWLETKTPTGSQATQSQSPFIGELNGVAYYLLYNGILGDRRPAGGNVLTSGVLAHLLETHPHTGKKVIFGEASRLGLARLTTENIEFKQIPYELHDRV